jgi:D-alanyl-D-alanine carboxypeptidase/D-alanyl-D-alanine-endopeptidase (penicillin-binding protein 4)
MPLLSHRLVITFSLGVFVIVLSALTFTTAHAASAARFPASVSTALERAHIPASAVSIWVQPVEASRPTLAINAERPMNPASVMKVVTTFAALELLGPSQLWTTRLASSAPLQDGVIKGDLYLIGDGDPVLTYERLWRLLRRLRMLGLARIDGDIVLDHAALALPPHDPNAFDDRGLRPYNAGADGLLLHFNTQELALFPGSQAPDPVQLVAEPPLAGLVIDNQVTTSDKSCEPWYRDLDARLEGNRLILFGSLPASCGPKIWATAPLLPPDFDVALLQALWQELGGTLRGTIRHDSAPAGAQILIADESVPLSEVVRTMNKWSNNVIARQLLANLGRTEPPPADMVAVGVEAARQSLSDAKIEVSGLVIDNGSGLSRIARIRADSLGTLLVRAWQRPWMPEFIASLPIVGRDGTTRKRLIDSPSRGYAHIKTGSINDVRAIAGYVLDRHGLRHAVVMMVNHPEAGNARQAPDALIVWGGAGGQSVSPPPAQRRGKR